MSNKTDLQTLNAQYESLIQTLSGKAAGGGSGGSVETCTVILKHDVSWLTWPYYLDCVYSTVENGDTVIKNEERAMQKPLVGNTTLQFNNVLCGSALVLCDYNEEIASLNLSVNDGGTAQVVNRGDRTIVITAPTAGGEICTISICE